MGVALGHCGILPRNWIMGLEIRHYKRLSLLHVTIQVFFSHGLLGFAGACGAKLGFPWVAGGVGGPDAVRPAHSSRHPRKQASRRRRRGDLKSYKMFASRYCDAPYFSRASYSGAWVRA
jgi:hypothetical protein